MTGPKEEGSFAERWPGITKYLGDAPGKPAANHVLVVSEAKPGGGLISRARLDADGRICDEDAVHMLGAYLASMIRGAPEKGEFVPEWALEHARVLLRKMKRDGLAIIQPQEGTR